MLTPFRPLLLASVLAFATTAGGQSTDQAAPAKSPSEVDLASYRTHLETLASPALEGRGPGLAGNRTAAAYFEHQFAALGLKPAFAEGHRPEGGVESPSYYQQFTAGREVKVREASISFLPVGEGIDPRVEKQSFTLKEDFNVLGNSGSAEVEGEIAFVGYSLEPETGGGGGRGGDGLKPEDATYIESDDLTGKIALLLRFEPMNDQGKSRLTESGGWSAASAISQKIMAAVKRNAAGIILVSPPGASDRRAFTLETPESSAAWTRMLSIPVVMLTTPSGDRLVRAASGKTLLELRKLADKGRAGLGADESAVITLTRAKVRVAATTERLDRITWNLGGILPGRGELASQYVVIGGHYDHVGFGYQGGSVSGEYGQIHPGADDNASGASGVLVAAEILTRRFADADRVAGADAGGRRSILFLGFSAEEMGLIGSREFVKASPIDAKTITAMLNMDMIGRLRPCREDDSDTRGRLDLMGTGTAEGFHEMIQPTLSASGLNIKPAPKGRGPSDHATFYGCGVPVLHFYTGVHEQYHTPRDTADLINVDGAVRIVDMLCDISTILATRPEQLVFRSTDGSSAGATPDPSDTGGPRFRDIKVRFGIAPANYAEEGEGVTVGDVFDGTSAAEAGIKTGDRLVRWNGDPIEDVQMWMGYLGKHKPGDTVDVTVMRRTVEADKKSPLEEIVVRVTLKARDQAPK